LSIISEMKDWSQYAWLDEDESDVVMAACLGVAVGATRETVLRSFDAEDDLGVMTLADAWSRSESGFGSDVVQVAEVDSGIVTIEPNGWHGVDGRVATDLSRDGSYAAFFWNVNAQMRFVYARNGVVVREFDPLLYDEGEQAAPALAEERDLPFPRDDSLALTPRRAALALLDLLTGVQVTRPWLLEVPRPTFRAHHSVG
jgi:hypothetical protein